MQNSNLNRCNEKRPGTPDDFKPLGASRWPRCSAQVGAFYRTKDLCFGASLWAPQQVRRFGAVSSRSGPRFREVCVESISRMSMHRRDIGKGVERSTRDYSAPLPGTSAITESRNLLVHRELAWLPRHWLITWFCRLLLRRITIDQCNDDSISRRLFRVFGFARGDAGDSAQCQ